MSVMFVKHRSLLMLLLIGIATLHVPTFSAENDDVSLRTTVAIAISLDDEPLANGRIFFHLPKNQFLGGKIESGKCRLDCVPAGTYKITIESEGLPRRYSSVEQAILTVQVAPGKNDFAFELLSD